MKQKYNDYPYEGYDEEIAREEAAIQAEKNALEAESRARMAEWLEQEED